MIRPEHITCIAHTHSAKRGTTWCGRDCSMEFAFVDIDHAAYNAQQQGRLVPCAGCLAAVDLALRSQGAIASAEPPK